MSDCLGILIRLGPPATPEHAMARARLTINAALSPQEAAGQPGAHTEPCQALRLACAGLWTPSKPAWFYTENSGSISAPKAGTCPPGPLITCINL